MRFQLKCQTCGETLWIKGTYEGDTNATVLDDDDPNWDDACEHVRNGGGDGFDIVDYEYPDTYADID